MTRMLSTYMRFYRIDYGDRDIYHARPFHHGSVELTTFTFVADLLRNELSAGDARVVLDFTVDSGETTKVLPSGGLAMSKRYCT